jgi:hypothetical protein
VTSKPRQHRSFVRRRLGRWVCLAGRYLYNHVNISAGFCPIRCVGLGFQGGTLYAYGGQWGISSPGASVGWSSRAGWKRDRYCRGIGGGAGWGCLCWYRRDRLC